MRARKEFKKNDVVRFSGTILHENLESKLVQYFSQAKNGEKPILLDLKNSSYIDVAALMTLIAFCTFRFEQKREVHIGIPKDKKIRDFLRVWRFPEAFKAATGKKWEDVIVKEDQVYRGEEQTTYTGRGDAINVLEYNPDWREGEYGRRNFFEFNCYTLSDNGDRKTERATIPRLEGSHWNGTAIREILRKHLGHEKQREDVARVVIYEAMSNAVRHPNARVVLAVSKFEKGAQKPSTFSSSDSIEGSFKGLFKGHLRICIWDDGDSIIDTLKPLIIAGKPIRSFPLPQFMYDRFLLETRKLGDKEVLREEIKDQSEDPDMKSSDASILLSSVYPGITRTIAEKVEPVQDFDPNNNNDKIPLSEKQGVGLYALLKTALDLYQGSIRIRCNNQLLTIELAGTRLIKGKGVRYNAEAVEYPSRPLPNFRGNLLTIHIPIRYS